MYGIGSYVRELIAFLKGSQINVCVVCLMSDKKQIQEEVKIEKPLKLLIISFVFQTIRDKF